MYAKAGLMYNTAFNRYNIYYLDENQVFAKCFSRCKPPLSIEALNLFCIKFGLNSRWCTERSISHYGAKKEEHFNKEKVFYPSEPAKAWRKERSKCIQKTEYFCQCVCNIGRLSGCFKKWGKYNLKKKETIDNTSRSIVLHCCLCCLIVDPGIRPTLISI